MAANLLTLACRFQQPSCAPPVRPNASEPCRLPRHNGGGAACAPRRRDQRPPLGRPPQRLVPPERARRRAHLRAVAALARPLEVRSRHQRPRLRLRRPRSKLPAGRGAVQEVHEPFPGGPWTRPSPRLPPLVQRVRGRRRSPIRRRNAWISYASRQDASHIVGINRLLPYYLAPDVFTSKHLKVLQLSRAVLVQGFFRQLSNYCPELKALFLSECRILDTNIYSETIVVLSLTINLLGDQPGICIPSLISLILHSRYGPGLPLLKSMESLEEAWILISRQNQDIDAPAIRQFLNSLSRVRRLEFDYQHRRLTMENNYHGVQHSAILQI
ncbi:uncharacterized protein LOC104584769 [Brachypodium distachyon]|uniref:uncharacterized protein LOC104584769 n=1 Tax=Brachypodium distachyon TaxID=15368 RepID=UPI000D0CC9DB|nr:uncharacterized protein LOC104584769 [Brachypodium distachyon]|eukprot:XP_024318734.1 uncharacterized protein LOC104584769 [Brachypodium distachyon]